MEVQFHAFVTSYNLRVRDRFHEPASFLPWKAPRYVLVDCSRTPAQLSTKWELETPLTSSRESSVDASDVQTVV